MSAYGAASTVVGGLFYPTSFIMNLRTVLDEETSARRPSVRWTHGGGGLEIVDRARFVAGAMTRVSTTSCKYESFVRNLNLYGFAKVHGVDKFVHMIFNRAQVDRDRLIRRTNKSTGGGGTASISVVQHPVVEAAGVGDAATCANGVDSHANGCVEDVVRRVDALEAVVVEMREHLVRLTGLIAGGRGRDHSVDAGVVADERRAKRRKRAHGAGHANGDSVG